AGVGDPRRAGRVAGLARRAGSAGVRRRGGPGWAADRRCLPLAERCAEIVAARPGFPRLLALLSVLPLLRGGPRGAGPGAAVAVAPPAGRRARGGASGRRLRRRVPARPARAVLRPPPAAVRDAAGRDRPLAL